MKRTALTLMLTSTMLFSACDGGTEDKIQLPEAAANEVPAQPTSDKATPVVAPKTDRRTFTGTFEPRRSSGVAASVGGVVRTVHVEEGDAVEKGDKLIDVDAANYRLQARQAEAAVDAAQSQIDLLQTEYDRAQKLLAKNAIAPSQVDQLRGQLAGAKAQLRQAQVGLDLARKQSRDSLIRAPFDGVVTKVNVAEGEFAAPGPSPLLEIDEQDLILRVQIPAEHVETLSEGMALNATVPALKRDLSMTVERINPRIARNSRSFDVIAVTEDTAAIRSGMFAEVQISAGGEQ